MAIGHPRNDRAACHPLGGNQTAQPRPGEDALCGLYPRWHDSRVAVVTIKMGKRKGDYGFDGNFERLSAPVQAFGVAAASAGLLALAKVSWSHRRGAAAMIAGAAASGILGNAGLYLHANLTGKFQVWEELLDGLQLDGNETLLDMGCGRGMVMLAAARRLPQGHVIGVDTWREADQTGNSANVTTSNAILEGVADRVEVRTADMTALPLADGSVDAVVSSLAIHNIASSEGRRQALREAARVLRPGGRLVVADLWWARQHADYLREMRWHEVCYRNLGWRMWYGGPWRTRAVTATKPLDR